MHLSRECGFWHHCAGVLELRGGNPVGRRRSVTQAAAPQDRWGVLLIALRLEIIVYDAPSSRMNVMECER
jgi:hypothetical protein